MKKRLLCLSLIITMICSIFLTSCDSTRTEEDIINDIINSGTTALTLSVWLPTDSDTSSPEFQERLLAVQDGINNILEERNEGTRIKLIAVNDSEYEQKIAERFASMKEKTASGETAFVTASKYNNKAERVFFDNGAYMYELVYPDVLDTQLDIFLVRGYDEYMSHVSSGNLYGLDNYLFADGSKYSNLTKMIIKDVFDQMKVNGRTYAIPNNHLYGDKYQYILINKEIFDSYENSDIDDIEDILSCENFIKKVGEAAQNGVVPFVATMDDAAKFVYWSSDGSQSLIGSDYNAPDSVFKNDVFNSYVSFYKRLNDLNYVKPSLEESEKAAVQILYGANTDVLSYEDEYYIVKSEYPVADEDSVFASMFSISSYSANYDRAMKILYLLQYNSEIRTILQYGISGEDYTIEYENDKQVIRINDESAYKMNLLYTGNCYNTYREDGSAIDDWDYVKEMNHETVISPYLNLKTHLNSLTAEEQQQLKSCMAELKILSEEIFDIINEYSAEEYDTFVSDFVAASRINIDDVEQRIEEYQKQLESETDGLAIERIQTSLNSQIESKNTFYKNEVVVKILESEAYNISNDLLRNVYQSFAS